eukprot:jgi/Botrbrau1/4178/Bobra.0192s0038.1
MLIHLSRLQSEQALQKAAALAKEAAEEVADAALDGHGASQEEVYRQVLFLAEAGPGSDGSEPKLALEGLDASVLGCLKRLGGDADALESGDLPRILLTGGWLLSHFRRQPACPPQVSASLFNVAVRSTNLETAAAAYKAVVTLLGDDPSCLALLSNTDVPQGTPLGTTQAPRQTNVVQFPTDTDYLSALRFLGYQAPGTHKGAGQRRGNRAGTAEAVHATEGNVSEEGEPHSVLAVAAENSMRLSNLQFLIRLLVAFCRAEAASAPSAGGLAGGSETPQLFLALLQLRFDPVAQILSPELEVAMPALLTVMEERVWERSFAMMVAGSSEAGNPSPSGRAHLEVLRRVVVPPVTRMAILWQHATLALLSRVVKGEVGGSSMRRGTPQLVNIKDHLESSSWLAGDPVLAAKAVWKKATGGRKKAPTTAEAIAAGTPVPSGSAGVVTLRVAIETADLLLWACLRDRNLDRAFIKRWHTFLTCISSQAGQAGDLDSKLLRTFITSTLTRDEHETS